MPSRPPTLERKSSNSKLHGSHVYLFYLDVPLEVSKRLGGGYKHQYTPFLSRLLTILSTILIFTNFLAHPTKILSSKSREKKLSKCPPSSKIHPPEAPLLPHDDLSTPSRGYFGVSPNASRTGASNRAVLQA